MTQVDESSQAARAVAAVVFCFLSFVNLNLLTDFCNNNIVGCNIQHEPKCGS